MRSQVRFAMHPADEQEFEQLLVADESIHFISGPRWKTKTPVTSRSLADIEDYCIIWSKSDLAMLKAEYIPSCDDWYCRSEHATIQFLRCKCDDAVITEGRIAVSTIANRDFPPKRVQALERRFGALRRHLRKNYVNSVLQWRHPGLPAAPAGPGRSANPSKPDAQVWVGPHALHWLREQPGRCVKQSRDAIVEAVLC